MYYYATLYTEPHWKKQ